MKETNILIIAIGPPPPFTEVLLTYKKLYIFSWCDMSFLKSYACDDSMYKYSMK